MSSIVIVGAGIVGYATGVALAEHGHQVEFVDASEQRRSDLRMAGWRATASLEPTSGLHTVFLCVPTPADERGYDLSALEEAVRSTVRSSAQHSGTIDLVVRSTVPPGTCDRRVEAWVADEARVSGHTRFHVVHCPEFLRQEHSIEDALHPRTIVIGATSASGRERVGKMMSTFDAPVELFETATAAELVKCAHNAYNATKISFWNEIYVLATTLGVDAEPLADVVSNTAEASWNPRYGIRGGRPYAGACLPKDVIGLIAESRSLGVDPILLAAVHERNRRASEPTP